MKVNLLDVIDAIDTVSEDETYFYSIQDEEIVYALDDSEDDEFFIPLPTKDEVNDYQNMVNFTETIEDEKKRDWFENAIHGKGAFRRFRATLERFGMETEWYDYLEASHRELAINWCEQHGIVYETSVRHEEVDDDWDEEDVVAEKEPVKQVQIPLRFVRIDEDNYMSALSLCDTYLQELDQYTGNSSSSDYDRAQNYLEEALEEKDIYVLSDHGRFIAMAICRMDGSVTTITDLCVVKDKRRSGVARKLISEIQKQEVQPLQFEVPTNNPTMHAFLQAIGYAKIIHTTYTK
ncbi:GNAT family N-acetyltransferase [uncultured Solobacterium sp.]|uniref:GNAT family N-acetyltransferase n=1 Tax=uncultured Solobacterium sp. TaxID=747375 RepID=UPI0025F12A3F|nr:GNAT family N-acetyltransferase [uncultured Solobacterium sp.]